MTGRSFVAIVDLPSNLRPGPPANAAGRVSTWTLLEVDVHPSLQTEELLWAEEICRKDPKVIASMKEIGIETENVFVDGATPSPAHRLRP